MAGQISLEPGDLRIAPSLLSADPLDMAGSIKKLKGKHDWLHIDIMDGHFVPNLSYGPSLVRALRRAYPDEILDVHLMVEPPEDFIEAFLDEAPDFLSVQVESTRHIHRVLGRIASRGVHPGVVLNPGTPVDLLYPVLNAADLVLVMSVNPGFGGQAFIPEVLDKSLELFRYRTVNKLSFLIEMDGGLGISNIKEAVKSGVDVAVMGSAIFSSPEPDKTIDEVRRIWTEVLL